MKTDELIEALGVTVERVEGRSFRNAFILALIVGAAVAVCAMQVLLGMSASALRESHLGLTILTVAFVVGVVAAGSSYLLKAAHPGMGVRGPTALIVLLVVAFLCAGAAGLLAAEPAVWSDMIFGPRWTVCLTCIPLFAIGPFIALVWILRKGAPTQLRATGAVAGLVAGALGAGACALHQPGGSLPFIGLWYAAPILLCALLGALLGRRVLRW
ncbi:MAG: NrsF family protein [Steroidobacteraceae bacterium]